jgi:hypothetical protein
LVRFFGPPGIRQVQSLPGRGETLLVIAGRPIGEVREELWVAGDPVGDDDQRGEQHLHRLRQPDRPPSLQPFGHTETLGAGVEQFGLHLPPDRTARTGSSQQFLTLVQGLDLAVFGRHAMMSAHGDRELSGASGRPPVPFLQPLSQQHLPGQTVRRDPPVRSHRPRRAHLQSLAAHRVGEQIDLTGERRGGLADVVHSGEPHGQGTCV